MSPVVETMDRDALRRRVEEINWWHTIPLGDGIVTPGIDDSPAKLEWLELPSDLTGKTVLDVGALDGFFSFEAERRGADRVLAIDSYSWSGPGWATKAGFDLAHEVLGSKVESEEMEVLDISPETVGEFDIVLFMGVLYHMRHPLLALERMASVTRELLILETAVDLALKRRAAAAFYPGQELDRDASNWWAPNPAAVDGMLRAVGFPEIQIVHPRSRAEMTRSIAHNVLNIIRSRLAPSRTRLPGWRWQTGRLVAHASR